MGVEIVTFGCRLNAFESEVIAREVAHAGLDDTIVINSCAVTNEAVAQARQSIRRLKRERPGARIVVTGCAAQTQAGMFADMSEVDRVVGNDDKMRAQAWREARAAFDIDSREKIAVSDIMAVKAMAPHLLEGFQSGLPRVFVQVQNGCDHRCTFCIIPFGRGNSRSVPMGAVVDQVRMLAERGHAEIVLTGVDLTSYGVDLPGAPKLGQLVRQILRHVPELKRLRISSIDSIEADRDLLDAMADDRRLMPHLHLSLQSASGLILKRMKRRHSPADAASVIRRARAARPGIAIGADLIAGFPTETDALFRETLDFVTTHALPFPHVFPYSERPGTPAARMPAVPKPVRKERAARLREAGQAAAQAFFASQQRRIVSILTESGRTGHTEHFAPVRLVAEAAPGRVLAGRVIGTVGDALLAEAA